MTDKKDPKDFDFTDSNDFDFGDEPSKSVGENVIKKQNTINEKSTITTETDLDDDFKDFDFGNGNAAAEETIEDDDVTDEDILNTMTYYVATYAKSVGGKKTIFKRFMDISRETDSHGNKNVAAMILFLTDLINGISDQDYFGNALDENKQEYMQAFAASIVFLAENRNWK
jgi:hypothetical protein